MLNCAMHAKNAAPLLSDPLQGEADSGSGPSHQRQCATETDAALC